MKRIFYILLILPIISFGQLNRQADGLKDNMPSVYQSIKYEAVKKWDTNYEMTLYEINQQSEELMKLMYLSRTADFEYTIYLTAIGKWVDEKEEPYNLTIFADAKKCKTRSEIINKLFELRCNWQMVKYEYGLQLKAKQSF